MTEEVKPVFEATITLTDDEANAIRSAQEHGVSFAQLVKGFINLAAPYGDPNDNSDIEMERERRKWLVSQQETNNETHSAK